MGSNIGIGGIIAFEDLKAFLKDAKEDFEASPGLFPGVKARLELIEVPEVTSEEDEALLNFPSLASWPKPWPVFAEKLAEALGSAGRVGVVAPNFAGYDESEERFVRWP